MSVGQSIEALDPATSQDLAAKREWVTGHYDAHSLDKYQTLTGKLDLLATILAEGWVKRADQLRLQSLGVGFGDAIAQDTLMEWVVVDDEYGRSAALNWPGTTLLCFPLTIISKRIENGEAVDVYDLFEGVSERLKELAFSGDYV